MRIMFLYFFLSIKRNLTRKNLLIAFLILLICLLYNHFGIQKDYEINNEISTFVQLEQKRVLRHVNILEYQRTGLKSITKPAPLFSLFFNSVPYDLEEASIDGIVKLEITKPLKGGKSTEHPMGKSNMDFSWFLLLAGSALACLWGSSISRDKEFLRMQLAFIHPRHLFSALILARLFLLLLFLLIIFFSIFFQFLLNGVGLSLTDVTYLLYYFLAIFIVMVLFMLIGGMIGTMKKNFSAWSTGIAVWLMIILLAPGILNHALSKYTNLLFDSVYTHELKKLKIFSNLQRRYHDMISQYQTGEEIKAAYEKLIKLYINQDLQDIIHLEEKMLKDTLAAAKAVHLASIFTPVTFYKVVNNEISGCGYNSHTAFYKTIIDRYSNFVRYCLKNTTNRVQPKNFPFIKNPTEYVFQFHPSLPQYFLPGLLLNLFIVIILMFICYSRFKKVLLPAALDKTAYSDLDISLEKGKHYVYRFDPEEIGIDFPAQLYQFLLNIKKDNPLTGKLSVRYEQPRVAYIPDISKIPAEMKTGHLVDYLADIAQEIGIPTAETQKVKGRIKNHFDMKKPFHALKRREKISFLIDTATLVQPEIFLLDEVLVNMEREGDYFEQLFSYKTPGIMTIEIIKGAIWHEGYDNYSTIYKSHGKLVEKFVAQKAERNKE